MGQEPQHRTPGQWGAGAHHGDVPWHLGVDVGICVGRGIVGTRCARARGLMGKGGII